MTNLITKLLGPPQEIGTKKHCLHRLYRWTILRNKRYKVYLDHSFGGASSGDLENYPERFISVGLAESHNMGNKPPFPGRAAWTLLIGKTS
jgi:hypothetical protein